jgi:hypothetical protein
MIIEKKTENFYRMISKKTTGLPNSFMQIKKTVMRGSTLSLTPQESEQLSAYVSNDTYVKKQKEDIEELASLFKGMLGEGSGADEYVRKLTDSFYPMDDFYAVFQIDLLDEDSPLIIDIQGERLNCYRGTADNPDVTAKVKSSVFRDILSGGKSFQSAFMSGELSVQGNFNYVRNFDTIFQL